MGKDEVTQKQGQEIRVGDRIVCEDGTARVIATIRPGPFPAMFEVSFHDGTEDILPAFVSFDVIVGGPRTDRGRMKLVRKTDAEEEGP